MQLLEISRTGDMADDEVFIVMQEEQISFGNNPEKETRKESALTVQKIKELCVKFILLDGSGQRSGS